MSKDTGNSLFINFSLNLRAEFYQRLLSNVTSFQELGNRLVRVAEHEKIFRHFESVRETAQFLINIPIRPYQVIGHYYLGWCEFMRGKDVKNIFELVAEYAPEKYRALAMYSLAAIEARKQAYDVELSWLIESMRVHPSVDVLRALAVVKAKEGYHKSAVRDLESIIPLIHHAEPFYYFDFLNSYAVELGIVGRKQEAQNISGIVLRSPFAYAYPEWRETAEDLKPANRSFVAFKPSRFIPRNVLLMPVVEYDENTARSDEPGRVLNLEKWKKKMGKKSNRNKKKPIEDMTEREMFFEIMNIYSSGETTEDQRRRILEAVVSIMSGPDKPEPDNPDGA